MNSKERVLTVFEHREPDRVPRWCGSSPEFWEKAKTTLGVDDEGLRRRFGDDFRRVFSRYSGPEYTLLTGATWQSPFGIQREGIGFGQPMSHPLQHAKTTREVLDFNWPDPAWMDVSHIREEAKMYTDEYAILGGEWAPFWHDVIDLVGMEKLYYLFYDEPDIVDLLFTKVTDFYYAVSEAIFEEAADVLDIFFIGNDFGSQTGPLLGSDLFSRFIVPHIARLTSLGHRYGLKTMLHCCGGFRELMPDLINGGMDAFHALQPYARGMDPAGLKRDFGSSVVLNGAIDSHSVLIDGESTDFVAAKTRETLEIMMPGGGYIGGASHDYILEETPVQNVVAMFDAIDEYGRY